MIPLHYNRQKPHQAVEYQNPRFPDKKNKPIWLPQLVRSSDDDLKYARLSKGTSGIASEYRRVGFDTVFGRAQPTNGAHNLEVAHFQPRLRCGFMGTPTSYMFVCPRVRVDISLQPVKTGLQETSPTIRRRGPQLLRRKRGVAGLPQDPGFDPPDGQEPPKGPVLMNPTT